MDVLWNPWRYDYIKGARPEPDSGCVFCDLPRRSSGDHDLYILKRADLNYVVLNIFPYAVGHILIIPYEHVASLDHADDQTITEMILLTRSAQTALKEVYSPDGFNMGMNLGRAAGAGVAEHLHMHILPRWAGDVNFMTAVGETRNIPEPLNVTYQRLAGKI